MPSRKKPESEAKPAAKKAGAKKATGVTKAPAKKKSTTAAAPSEAPVPASKRTQDLVIVESPAKSKTIAKYLGPNFRVLASYGHVRDLPTRGIKGEEIQGVNISEGWKARYVVADKAKRSSASTSAKSKGRRTASDILDELRREANRSARVFLATDPDREGEAIAWHIEDELGLEDERTFRITFNEITRTAVQNALASPTKIHRERVKAQEARRILDRVVGFPLSNLLGSKVTQGLSAGRVQSVAVRMIVDRELEIEAFRTEEFWRVHALLSPTGAPIEYTAKSPDGTKILADKKQSEATDEEPADGDGKAKAKKEPVLPKPPDGAFMAELARWDKDTLYTPTNEKAESGRVVRTEAEVDEIMAALRDAKYKVTKVEQKNTNERPQAPFTTSTLQQQANIRLGYSSTRTMTLAQKLYEGVTVGGEGSVALITYMRTDSTRISNDAMTMVRGHIDSTYGDRYLPEKPHSYTSGKSAQEAHEAVRPTDLKYTPDRVKASLEPDQLRLYTLIYNRFVASQMAPAIFAVTNVEITAGPGLLKAQGKIQKFDGYRKVLPPGGKQEDVILPDLDEGTDLNKHDVFGRQHYTQPPSRFSEATLVKAMEKEGIGRPSTYASIISVIQNRGYVEQIAKRFHATEMGKTVTKLLVEHFPRIMDLKFTSRMEDELDQIETGKTGYAAVLDEFWGPFSEALRLAEEKMPRLKGVEIGEPCPKCGRPLLQQFSAKTGKPFVGCSGYREEENPCKFIRRADGTSAEPELTEFTCPSCGKQLAKKEGKKGAFYGCTGYPECKTIMNIGPEGEPILAAQQTDYKCEKCDSPMVLRQGKNGPFFGCSGYPKCRNIQNVGADGKPMKPATTGIKCEKCGSEMNVKNFRGRSFLGCSAYPKCKTTAQITDELREKLGDLVPPAAPKEAKAKADEPEIEVKETCPECGGPMKIRRGRGGDPFLGCKAYPKCKGTRPATDELKEQWNAAQGGVGAG